MMRILRNTTASVTKTSRSTPGEQYDVVDDDLSAWEFVDASLSDEEDLYSFDGDGLSSEEGDDGVISEESESKTQEEEEEAEEDVGALDDVMSLRSLSVSPPVAFPVEVTDRYVKPANDLEYDDVRRVDDDDDDGEEEDLYGEDVFDDELVPWTVKGKFGKQRIRKMGKRGGPKFNKSKRLPYHYNRPGCLYGKHGLGVQHSYV